MNLRFPLSLKVSLWLLLNLGLLALLGGTFIVTQSGFGWDALVAGPAGERLQAVADVIAAELRHEPNHEPDEVLARYSTAYGVEFTLFQNDGRQLGGPSHALPPAVRARLVPGARPPRENPPEALAPEALRDNFTAPPIPPPAPASRRESGGAGAPRDRFLVRSNSPVAYWAGVRLPPIPGLSYGRPNGTTLLLRAPSLGSTALLLDLKPWLFAGAAALVFSILFWLPLVRSITRALGKLTHATEQIAAGRFETRVDAQRRDELGRLGGAVNRMAGQLDQLVSGQKRFLGDIAHELGSPLGRMQLGVGILEERAAPTLQPAVADVREEVQHMAALVHELLAFTKAGLRARDAALARVELRPLLNHVLGRENAADLVVVTVPAELAVQADADLLARALGNLIRNALRYAADAGPITLTASMQRDQVSIIVEDHGPGVPAETISRLGEPFYRPEFARTRETGGAGLGLAIVKSAVEACRGSVRFSNREPHGFRAEIHLPAANFTQP